MACYLKSRCAVTGLKSFRSMVCFASASTGLLFVLIMLGNVHANNGGLVLRSLEERCTRGIRENRFPRPQKVKSKSAGLGRFNLLRLPHVSLFLRTSGPPCELRSSKHVRTGPPRFRLGRRRIDRSSVSRSSHLSRPPG